MTTSQSPAPDSTENTAPQPRRRSFLWVFIGILVGLLVGLLVLFFYGREPAPVPQTSANELVRPEDLLETQRAQNNGLEEELRRLQAALKEDPCAVPAILGTTPDKTPIAPEYATPPQKTSPVPPTVNGTAPTPTAPPPPTPGNVGELMDQATVFIISIMGEQVGTGSGFFVAPGIIATNRHVAQGKTATLYAGNKILGGMHEATLIAFSDNESRDYALLRIDPGVSTNAPILRIADRVSRTDRVSAWGFPGYITEIDPKLVALAKGDSKSVPEVVYSEGVVSVILERVPPIILHTASLSQGNSGGPLINAQGSVVGINTFIRAADSSYAQANIALPGRDLALFLREHGITVSSPTQ